MLVITLPFELAFAIYLDSLRDSKVLLSLDSLLSPFILPSYSVSDVFESKQAEGTKKILMKVLH